MKFDELDERLQAIAREHWPEVCDGAEIPPIVYKAMLEEDLAVIALEDEAWKARMADRHDLSNVVFLEPS